VPRVPATTTGPASGPTVAGDTAPTARVAGAAMAAVVVIWGLGPPITKLIGAPPLVSVSVRFWISVPVVWAMTYASGRRVTWEVLRRTAPAGVFFGVNLAFVFSALQHASVAVIAVVQALQPAVVLLVAGPWLGERATRWHVMWTLVGVGGVALVILGGDRSVSGDGTGLVYAIAAMLTFTAYYLLNRRVRSTTAVDALQWMAGVTLFAGLTITPVALAVSSPDDYRQLAGADWVYLAFIAGAVGIVGHTLMSWVHKYTPASRSSLYLLAMNVVAIAAAWPIHDEPVTVVQGLGGAVVLGAIAAVVSRPAAHITR
jgi:probable blue pigment (indigoidine) exporter